MNTHSLLSLFFSSPDAFHHHRHRRSSPVNIGHRLRRSDLTARKLAASLWQLRSMKVYRHAVAFAHACSSSSSSQLAHGNVKITFPHSPNATQKHKQTKKPPRRPVTILRSTNGLLCQHVPCVQFLKCSKEEATKWDPTDLVADPTWNDFTKLHSRLVEELIRAQRSIDKLRAAHKSSKKKEYQFLQNLKEEKSSWKLRERKRMEAVLDDLRDKLARERRSRERMELLNGKLVQELAMANSSAKQLMTKYDKEKKERELLEQVCNELGMQLVEDRAELEALLRESSRICDQVREERRLARWADLWREERVQMKLGDSKILLEDKYKQMVQLISYLQTFLESRGAAEELEDARLIQKAIDSVSIQRIVDLSYDFSKTDDEEFRKTSVSHETSVSGDHKTCLKLISSEEPVGDHRANLCSSTQRRDTNLIAVMQGKNVVLGSDAIKCSDSMSCKSKIDGRHRHKSRGASTSCCDGYVEGRYGHCKVVGESKLREKRSMNPHITRGMKGCIEWPKGIPKANSTVIPLEQRVRSQKSQMLHMLKPKA